MEVRPYGNWAYYDTATYLSELSENDLQALPEINLSREDFFDALTLILNNAELHGFSADQKGCELRIRLDYTTQPDHITVDVSNNGKPFPDGMDTRRFTTRHEVAGDTGNTGIGGHHLLTIVEHANGSLEIASDEDALFPVTVTLTFPTL